MAEPAKAKQAVEEPVVWCTYPECDLTFTTEKQMKKHKVLDPDHNYCRRCDEDFDDELGLHLHKARSSRHIVCVLCGDEFKSEGGRDIHTAQMHRASQEVTCPDPECGAKFPQVHSLISHLESGDCSKITPEEYKKRRVEKYNRKLFLTEALGSSVIRGGGGTTVSQVSEHDGGVDLLQFDDDEGKPVKLEAGSTIDNEDAASETKTVLGKQWTEGGSARLDGRSVLGAGNARQLAGRDDTEEADLMAFSDTHSIRQDPASRRNSALLQENIAPADSAVNGLAADLDQWGLLDDGGARRIVLPQGTFIWDPSKFWNPLLGMYACECDKSFKTAKELEQHIHVHAGGTVRCPGCLKLFKSRAALVAHMESAALRCRVRERDDFGQIVDDITGGVVEAKGYYADGSIKYETVTGSLGKTPKEKPKLDLNKVAW